LRKIINAGGDGNGVASIQGLGRVLRKFEGKERGVFIDFMDCGRFSKKWSRKRLEGLKQQGHRIEVKIC
jgi:hypothetical protein